MGLRIFDVSHAYNGADVVRRVSLSVPPGEVACLLGPSGCGKTTLLRLAAGLEPLRRGRIAIGDRQVADGRSGLNVPTEDRRAGLMFQDYALFPHLTVAENVAFGLPNRAMRRRWVTSALERVGLASLADSYPHTLSGGQAQRCALLRALAPEPLVLLLDEPFSGLDVTYRALVREQTLTLLRESGVATLIVTHDPEEAMFMADRLWIMNDGAIIQGGTPAETYLHPASAYVASLFGPLNRIEGTVRKGRIGTPLGPIDATGFPEATRARVLVRPEGLRVGQGSGAPARIVAARLLGRCSHLRLAVDGLAEPLQALVPGVFLPEKGTPVALNLDATQAFVFPLDDCRPATSAELADETGSVAALQVEL
jgi:iron(III) transport system ATP-binding protein